MQGARTIGRMNLAPAQSPPLISWLDDPADPASLGGKASSLVRLLRAGLNTLETP